MAEDSKKPYICNLKSRYPLDPGFRAEVERYHAKDVRLYRNASERRKRRP